MNAIQNTEKQGGWINKPLYSKKPSADQARRGAFFMPLQLRTAISKYGITQGDLAQAVRQPAKKDEAVGKQLSSSAMSLLLGWGKWPKTTTKASIKKQTKAFLIKRGVPADVIKTIWEEELNNDARQAINNPRNARSEGKNIAGIIDASFLTEISTPEAVMLTQEAQDHFGLRKNPFKYDMNGSDDFFQSVPNREISQAMYQAAKFGGLIAVIGESGSGKTEIKKELLRKIGRDNDNIIVIQPQNINQKKSNSNSLLEAIIKDLDPKASIPIAPEAKARLAIKKLSSSHSKGNKHVLLQEEAHKHDSSIFPFYKQLWEFESATGSKLLGVVLIGQPELKYHLSLQHNWGSREFINRCEVAELMPLDSTLEAYLKFKFDRAGVDVDRVIESDAYDCLREVMYVEERRAKISILHPLFVNNRIVQCMNLCAEIGMPLVNADAVRKVKL